MGLHTKNGSCLVKFYSNPPSLGPSNNDALAKDRGRSSNVYASSQRYNISPPRCRAEQPRINAPRSHRDVSPLGSSRFEKPYSESSPRQRLECDHHGIARPFNLNHIPRRQERFDALALDHGGYGSLQRVHLHQRDQPSQRPPNLEKQPRKFDSWEKWGKDMRHPSKWERF
jgi:hypothetical protein